MRNYFVVEVVVVDIMLPDVIVVDEGMVPVEVIVVVEGIVVVEVIVVLEGIVVVEVIVLLGDIMVVEDILLPDDLVAACAAAARLRIRSAESKIVRFILFSPWKEFSLYFPRSVPIVTWSENTDMASVYSPSLLQAYCVTSAIICTSGDAFCTLPPSGGLRRGVFYG